MNEPTPIALKDSETEAPEQPKNGRPSIYTEELAERVLSHFANGGTIPEMNADPALPSWTTLHRWKEADESFRTRYTRAREAGTHFIADAGFEAAKNAADRDGAASARVHLDGAKWLTSVMNPRRFTPQTHLPAVGLVSMEKVMETVARLRREALEQAGDGAKDVTPKPPLIEAEPAKG